MSYFPAMQKGNLDSVKSDAHGKIKKETVSLQGRLIPLSQVGQYLGLAGQIRNGAGFDFFRRS